MSAVSRSPKLTPALPEGQMDSMSLSVFDETNTLNRMIDNVIYSYISSRDSKKAYTQLVSINRRIENIFDGLQNQQLDEAELEDLTNLCRRINEDRTLQQIMDLGSQSSKNNKSVGSLDSLDSQETTDSDDDLSVSDEYEAISHPSLNLSAYEQYFNNSRSTHDTPSISRKLLDTTIEDANTSTSKSSSSEAHFGGNSPIIPSRITTSDWASEGEELFASKTQNTSIVEVEVPQQSTVNDKIESLFSQMENEYNEHGIDRAYRTLESVKQLSKSQDVDQATLKAKFNEKKELIGDIERFYQESRKVLKELQDEEGYLTESSKKNASIKYKNLSDGKISIKMESTLEVPLATLMKLFYEPDGYKLWSPFVSESSEIKKLFRAGTATRLRWNLPPPVSGREGYLIGVGFDRLQENGSLLLISRTIQDDKQIQERYNIDIPSQSKTVRMDIPYVGVELVPLTPEKTKMRIVAMFDAKIKLLPARFVSWIVRKGAHFLLEKIVKSALSPKGAQDNKYAVQNKEFYGWLENLLNNYFEN